MPISGADIVAKNIIKYQQGFIKATNLVMRNIEGMLDQEITKNISLTDHSLQDLAKLRHPYGFGKGELHDPNYQVHTQSGTLLSSKSSGTEDADINEGGTLKASAFVQLDPGIAPHAIFVVYGTSKMIPRPVMSASRDKLKPDILDFIQSNLKDLKVSFG